MNSTNANAEYQYQYHLSDGRVLLSQTDLHYLVKNNSLSWADLKSEHLKDACILPNQQIAFMLQCIANGGIWAKSPSEASDKSFERNYCIQSGNSILINNGGYTKLADVLKINNKDALKIIIGRLARQAALAQAYCACLQHSAEAGGSCE